MCTGQKVTWHGFDIFSPDLIYSGRWKWKRDFTYGIFEARLKVPKGKGYLPAFWLMTTGEKKYGQWLRCGEIDIMEVLGRDTKTNYGTIHYGIPTSRARERRAGRP